MPRGPRLDHPGAMHHVIARGIARFDLFADDDDRRRFLAKLSRLVEETGTRCLAWTLMSNHYHLLVETRSTPLSTVMHRLNQCHAQRFNARHDRVGKLYQDRFKSIRVDDDAYLFRLVGYIHLNPVAAGIVALGDLDRHPWTGHAALMGRRSNRFQDVDGVLSLFGRTRAEARDEMRRFVAGLAAEGDAVLPPKSPASLDLSTRAQADDMVFGLAGVRGRSALVEQIVSDLTARDVRRTVLRNAGWTVDRLLVRACDLTGASEADVRRGRRTSAPARARAIVAFLATDRLAEPLSRTARVLGVGASAMARCVDRGRALCASMDDGGDRIFQE